MVPLLGSGVHKPALDIVLGLPPLMEGSELQLDHIAGGFGELFLSKPVRVFV